MLVYFRWDWDVHWGYGVLTHGHVFLSQAESVPSAHLFQMVEASGNLSPLPTRGGGHCVIRSCPFVSRVIKTPGLYVAN